MPKKNEPKRFKSLPFEHEAYAVDDALGVPRAAFRHLQKIDTDAPENCWPCREYEDHASGTLTRYTFDFLNESDFSTGRHGVLAELDRIEVYWKLKVEDFAKKAKGYRIELEEHAVLKTMLEGWANARDKELETARIEKERGAKVSEEFFRRRAKVYDDKLQNGKAFLERPGRKGRVPQDLMPDLACGRMVPLDPVLDNYGKWLKQVESAARRVCSKVSDCRRHFEEGHIEMAMLFALDLGQAVAQAEVLLESAPLRAGRTLAADWTLEEAVEEAKKIINSTPFELEDLRRVGLGSSTLGKALSAAATDGAIPNNGLQGKGGNGRRFSAIGVRGWILERLMPLFAKMADEEDIEEDNID